ncbi:hypothetical protein HJC99_02190 [Candidatus Saccharibacteria bacterium]|nr:hypothetical protein [Candidatus Saccharibacteria bacterium]
MSELALGNDRESNTRELGSTSGEDLASVTSITDAPRLRPEAADPLEAQHLQQLKVLQSREQIARASFEDWAKLRNADVTGDRWTDKNGDNLDIHYLHEGVDLNIALQEATAAVQTFINSMPGAETVAGAQSA